MPAAIRIKRGTRADLTAAVAANALVVGEPYLITDENRQAVGTGVNTYSAAALQSECVTRGQVFAQALNNNGII